MTACSASLMSHLVTVPFQMPQQLKYTMIIVCFSFACNSIDTTSGLLRAFPILADVFRKHNGALPSSAATKRLFSTAGQILTARRCKMSDTLFEQAVFLRYKLKELWVFTADKQWAIYLSLTLFFVDNLIVCENPEIVRLMKLWNTVKYTILCLQGSFKCCCWWWWWLLRIILMTTLCRPN